MTAEEFLTQLERCLHSLTPEERENAMSYYREYLEEAGEHAADAVESLGSPQAVAGQILSDMREPVSRQKRSAGNTVIGIIVLIVTSPFWGIIAVLWLTLLFSLAVILSALAFSAIFAPIQGISFLSNQFPGEGLWAIGSGLLCAGLTMLLWKPMFLLCRKSTGLFLDFCRNNWNLLFRKES